MTNVFENSQKMIIEKVEDKSLKTLCSTDDLTEIKGIGPSTALKLNRANIHTFKQLASVSTNVLSEIPGINIITAHKLITGAKTLLGEFKDKLEDTAEIINLEKEIEEDKIENFEITDVFVEEIFPQKRFRRIEDSIENTQEQGFDEKFKFSQLTASYPPTSKNLSTKFIGEIEGVQEKPQERVESLFNEETFFVEKPESLEEDSREEFTFVPEIGEAFKVEDLSKNSDIQDWREETKIKLEESFESSGYYIIPNEMSSLSAFIENLDYLGCKLIRVSKSIHQILLIPIKICDLEGTVLVDEDKLEFAAKTTVSNSESMSRLWSYSKNLLYARDLIYNDIINDNNFREFFQKYLQVSLRLEKSVGNKKLFFISGQTQYKVLIEPIMLCKTSPRCMEKSISFPYQRKANLHVIHQPDLPQLLSFLEQKYRLIESCTKDSNCIDNFQKMDEKLRTNVRIVSIPLLLYAIVLAIIYFAELFFLLRLFNSIGFAIIGIYISILTYLYLKHFRAKNELLFGLATPYYMQNLECSEIDLLEFKDQLSIENMAQLGYECFGKGKSYKILEQIEEDKFKNNELIKQKKFEPQVTQKSKKVIEKSISFDDSKYNDKYLSFLED